MRLPSVDLNTRQKPNFSIASNTITMDAAGYSGTPLAKKLGIKEAARIRLVNPLEHYFDLFNGLPEGIKWLKDRKSKKDMIHYFGVSLKALEKDIATLKLEIEPSGMIWVSWPKELPELPRTFQSS